MFSYVLSDIGKGHKILYRNQSHRKIENIVKKSKGKLSKEKCSVGHRNLKTVWRHWGSSNDELRNDLV